MILTIGGNDRTCLLVDGTLSVEHRAAGFISICSFTLLDVTGAIAIAAEDAVTVITGATTFFSGRVVEIQYLPFANKNHRHIKIQCQDLNAQLGEVIIDAEHTFPDGAVTSDKEIINFLFETYLPAVDEDTHVDTIQDPLTITVGPCTIRSALSQICTQTGGYFYMDFANALHYFDVDEGVALVPLWWLSDDPDYVDSFPYRALTRKEVSAIKRLDGVFVVGAGVSGWRGAHGAGDRTAIVRDNRITTATGVNNRGDAILNRYNAAQVVFYATITKDGLTAGQDVRFICALFDIDDTLTVRMMTVKWDVDGTPFYELELGDPINPSLLGEQQWIEVIEENQGPVPAPLLPVSSRGWSHNLSFSAVDHNTVQWTGGSLFLADGTVFAGINAANTGNIGADPYHLYFDITTPVDIQMTTNAASAIGTGKILLGVCTATAVGKACRFKIFGGDDAGGVLIIADNIVAGTVTTNEIAANTILAGNIAAGAIEADEIAAGAVTTVKLDAQAVTADKLSIGSSFYNAADGLMLFNGFSELERDGANWYWWSVGRQRAIVTGAIHQVQGRWQGTRALVVEPGTLTNLLVNPSFEVNVTDGWVIDAGGGAGASRITAIHYIGSACMGLKAGNGFPSYATGDSVVVANGETIVVSCWAWTEATVALMELQLHDVTSGITRDSQVMTKRVAWEYLEASWTNDTGVNKTCYLRFKNNLQNNSAYVYIDACMTCHDLDYGPRYFDGTMGEGYAWTGVAHNSTSTRTKTTVALNTYRRLLASNNTFSVRIVAQMPLNAVDEWPIAACQLFDVRAAADNNNRVYLSYNDTTDDFRVYINGAWSTVSAAQTFKRGDWLDIVATFDFAADDYNLYINGVLEDNDATARVAPAGLTLFYIGSNIGANQQAGYAFAEVAFFDRVVTAVEVAQLSNLQRPLVDAGTDLAPGIYIVDGKFKMASSTSGVRMELDEEGLTFYNSAGNALVELDASDASFILKSATAGARVELDTSGLRFIDGAGETLVNLDASDASFTLKSAIAGNNRIEISPTEIVGYSAANDKQFSLSATDGKAYAGAGAVVLHEDGIDIDLGGDAKNRISFMHTGTERGYIWAKTYATGTNVALQSGPPTLAAHLAAINVYAKSQPGKYTGIDINSEKTGFSGYINLWVEDIQRFKVDNAETNIWKLLVLNQAVAAEGYLEFVGATRPLITGITNSVLSVRARIGGTIFRLALYADG